MTEVYKFARSSTSPDSSQSINSSNWVNQLEVGHPSIERYNLQEVKRQTIHDAKHHQDWQKRLMQASTNCTDTLNQLPSASLASMSDETDITICLTSSEALEAYLLSFVRWALRVTSTGECSGDMAIALLEKAWAAQKLLWQVREVQIAKESQTWPIEEIMAS